VLLFHEGEARMGYCASGGSAAAARIALRISGIITALWL
jgi:hypothetical protein